MEFKPKKIGKFQEGGAIPAEDPTMAETPMEGGEGMPAGEAPQGEQDPIMMLAQAAMQALQSQDCNMMAQVCQGFLQLVQQMQGGGGAPAEEPQGEPVFRKGGVLTRRIKK